MRRGVGKGCFMTPPVLKGGSIGGSVCEKEHFIVQPGMGREFTIGLSWRVKHVFYGRAFSDAPVTGRGCPLHRWVFKTVT